MGKSLLNGERERQREMLYLPVLLLISSAFGMPSKAADNELRSFIDFSKETADLLDNSDWIKEVFDSLEKTEPNVLGLEVELKTLPYEVEGLGIEGNYFPAYNEAKRYLRETGQKLRGFAYKAKAEVRDLKTLFAGADESNDSDLLLVAIQKMTGFMSDTLEKFREANEKYKTAKTTFVNLKNFSTGSKEKVEKMLIEGSVEQEEWKKVVRDAVREENNIPEKTKTLKAKIMALFEEIKKKGTPEVRAKVEAEIAAKGDAAIDRAIKSLIESKVEADIEAAIERYNAKLNNLKKVTVNMLETGRSFEKTIDNAMNILDKNIKKITMSSNSANVFSKNKDEEEILTKYRDVSNDLKQGLDDLKNSAETFLAKQ